MVKRSRVLLILLLHQLFESGFLAKNFSKPEAKSKKKKKWKIQNKKSKKKKMENTKQEIKNNKPTGPVYFKKPKFFFFFL